MYAAFLLMPPLLITAILNRGIAFHSLLFFTGWLSWTYTEYFFHRFIMHGNNNKKGIGKLLNHHHHHIDPKDIHVTHFHRWLMIAGCVLIIIASIQFNNYTTLLCGYFIGFTMYSFMHVVLHQKWSQKIFPRLHTSHIHHHCKYPDKCFGVMVTWWDGLFGTAPSNKTDISDKIKLFYYKKCNNKKTGSCANCRCVH